MAELTLLRFSTAGSVDDGKSTLIGRLLHDANALYDDHLEALRKKAGGDPTRLDFALITDGLKAEREQGITIDVAYRYFSTPRRRFIIADTPGHEQYTRNMATGASTADAAVVLIDARLGILSQSRRHGFITSLLGVPHLIVTINKMDLVSYDEQTFLRLRDEYQNFTARLGFSQVTFIPISALHGDNVVSRSSRMPWYNGPPLLEHLESLYVAGAQNLIDFRFPVQLVLRPDHDFRGYCGQIASGVVRVGDEVIVLSSGRRSRVRRIVTPQGDAESAFPPMSVTLCLDDEIDISRGDMLAHPNNLPRAEKSLDAMVVWMSDTKLQAGQKYLLKHTTSTVPAICSEVLYKVDPNTLRRDSGDTLSLNDIGRARFSLLRPLYVDEYKRSRRTGSFVVIDPIDNVTLAAGMVTDRRSAQPAKRREISWQSGAVPAAERFQMMGQKPVTVWLTGLSGSGKSSIAFELERRLMSEGRACYVLDGDNVRYGLNRDLGFSPADRTENIRRIAEVARLFNDAGLIVITAFISPYAEDREMAKNTIGAERFLEVWLSTDIAVCEERDPKGLYAKARRGEIAEFTGVSAPYEPPSNPNLVLDTAGCAVDVPVQEILAILSIRTRI